MEQSTKRPALNWLGKFRVAFRGIGFGVFGQASFLVHFTVTLLVVIVAILLRVDWMGWGLLLLSIGLVLTAELMNSAIEILFRSLPSDVQATGWPALDIAAGAVLVASMIAASVGGLVFVPRIVEFFG